MNTVLIRDTLKESISNIIDEIFEKYEIEKKVKNKKVLVKPNLLAAFPPERGVTSDPRIVKEIVCRLKKYGAKEITVGDNSGSIHFDPWKIGRETGILEASDGCYKNIAGEVIEVEVKSKYLDKIIISRVFTDVDYIINVPKFKTHGLVKITGAVKNMYGMIPGGKKAQLHTLSNSVKEFAELLVDIYQIRIPDLNIMDAIIGMEGNGPTNGKPRSINKILCSDNGVAIDTVMATMMGLQSSMIETIQIANERGLGEMDLHKIEIDGKLETISDFKTPEKGIFHKIGRFMTPYTFKYAQVKPIVDKQKCKKCYQCIKVCPTKAMQIKNGFPEADRKQCISCFCCDEHCPYSAIILPPWHIDLLNRIKGR